jgi:hypothetical protein
MIASERLAVRNRDGMKEVSAVSLPLLLRSCVYSFLVMNELIVSSTDIKKITSLLSRNMLSQISMKPVKPVVCACTWRHIYQDYKVERRNTCYSIRITFNYLGLLS